MGLGSFSRMELWSGFIPGVWIGMQGSFKCLDFGFGSQGFGSVPADRYQFFLSCFQVVSSYPLSFSLSHTLTQSFSFCSMY
jgi:hypothetical protein